MQQTLEKVQFAYEDISMKDQFLVGFLTYASEPHTGILPIHVDNINDIPVRFEVLKAESDGYSITGYIDANDYNQYVRLMINK